MLNFLEGVEAFNWGVAILYNAIEYLWWVVYINKLALIF